MKTRLILLLLLISLSVYSKDQQQQAINGVLDLRNEKDPSKMVVKLNGEWEFYWMKMLHPHDLVPDTILPDFYGKVPAYWTEYPGTKSEGYATYRLKILLPEGYSNALGIDLPVFDSSYDIYVNGKYLGGNGVPGKTALDTKPEYKRNFFRILPAPEIDILINVSNFDHRRGGFWLPVKFGSFQEVQKRMAKSWAAEWSVISLLLGFSIFFFFFFLISPREKLVGCLSMLTTGIAVKPLFTTHYLILDFISINWIWVIRCEYFCLYIMIIALSWYACNLYPSTFSRIQKKIVTVIFTLFFVLTIFLPVRIFSYSTIIFYPALVIVVFYQIFMSLRGSIQKKPIDMIYLVGFILLFSGALNDIKIALGKGTSSSYVTTYIIIFFVFMQASIILYKWVKAFKEKENLQNELEYMNRNLELLVNERTSELKKKHEEIREQNKMIAEQNKTLSETIQLKNRIFSVIAHDLRSPVVNILYMLNLLKEKEYKEKYDIFANSSIQYAQRVIGLLENMLVWGRGQEDKIKFSPEKHDLADIILTNLSIFKETADKKQISVNFTQVGSPIAVCDKDLLDIIIRNLLSNAVKYTSRRGRISIFLKDKKSSGEGIMLKICDNGIGIPEEKQKSLFETAEVESTPGTENEKGTGLGLKLCYELVRINKGTLSVESKPGEGTSFIIMLPA
ncbi:MAG TPA: sensor histidine kinase [Bacteroidales bacterium]|nr:sensor histidine kinase [Bacteroidales bacterium]